MKKKFFKVVIVCLAMVWGASSVSAHTMYIQPSHFQVHKGKSSPFFFCYGHRVPVDDGIRAKKLQKVMVIPPKGEARTIALRDETGLHSYMVDYNMPGTWMVAARTTPGFYTVYVDQKGREHHVIKSLDHVKDKAQKIIMSLFVKQYSKSYVSCGEPSKGPMPAAGLALELVPVNDLFSLKPGQTLEVEILKDGKPFDGEGAWSATYNGFSTGMGEMYYPSAKLKGSRFSMVVDHPGRWFVRYSTTQKAPESKKDQYHELKLSTSMVFQVETQRKK